MNKSLVIFDSAYGNTEKVARAIAAALGPKTRVEILRASEVNLDMLAGVDLLVIGSPTQGFRPTKFVADVLKRLHSRGLKGVEVAAFDTRFEAAKLNSPMLQLLIRTGGYAAPRIAASLKKAGATLVAPPEGFFVEDTQGPLKSGELERASAWARSLPHSSQIQPGIAQDQERRD